FQTIGLPRRDPLTRNWSVSMSRPIELANGFRGLVVADVPYATFADFFNAISISDNVRITVLTAGGIAIATEPPDETVIGKAFGDHPQFRAIAHDRQRGTFLSVGLEDGSNKRVVTFERVPARPLIVLASTNLDRQLAGWW